MTQQSNTPKPSKNPSVENTKDDAVPETELEQVSGGTAIVRDHRTSTTTTRPVVRDH